MKLLRIEDGAGAFLDASGQYVPVDRITKEEMLRLVSVTLESDAAELDPYDEVALKNAAHQVIYKSISQKLSELRTRRKEFVDESARLYLDDYERYRVALEGDGRN